jgi:hypothetical protein
MNEILGALKSKTIWLAVATILVTAVIEPTQAYAAAHPGIVGSVIGVLIAIARGFTSQSLAAKGTPTL